MSRFLDRSVLGFMEGTTDAMRSSIARRFLLQFGREVDSVTVLLEEIPNPTRRVLSVHLECGGEHYESIIRNIMYDDGEEV